MTGLTLAAVCGALNPFAIAASVPMVGRDHGCPSGIIIGTNVALIEERDDGVFLDRFADDGSSAGDTWHRDVAEAKAQADAEYGGLLTEWYAVPAELTGSEAVAVALAQARLIAELNPFQERVLSALEHRLRFSGRQIDWRRVSRMKASMFVRVLVGAPRDNVLEMGIGELPLWIYSDGCEFARGSVSRSFEQADFESLDELQRAFVAADAAELQFGP